eukprot:scaffold29655_cov44-Phaeocystis_antarctica.AAC.1
MMRLVRVGVVARVGVRAEVGVRIRCVRLGGEAAGCEVGGQDGLQPVVPRLKCRVVAAAQP